MKTEINQHSDRYETMLKDMTNIQFEWLFYKKVSEPDSSGVGYLGAFVTDAKQLCTVGPLHRSRFMDGEENLRDNFLGIPLMHSTPRMHPEDDTHGIFFASANPGTIAMMHILFNEIGTGMSLRSMHAICIMRAMNSKGFLAAISVKQFNINNLLGLYSYGSAERFIMAVDGEVVSDRGAIGVGVSIVNTKYQQTLYSKIDNCSTDYALSNYSDDEYKDLIYDLVNKGV